MLFMHKGSTPTGGRAVATPGRAVALRVVAFVAVAALAGCAAYDADLVDWEAVEGSSDGGGGSELGSEAIDGEGADRRPTDSATAGGAENDGGPSNGETHDGGPGDDERHDGGASNGEGRDGGPLDSEATNGAGDDNGQPNDGGGHDVGPSEDCDASCEGVSCTNGDCSQQECPDGFADCDGQAENACETELGTLDDCSRCGDNCRLANAVTACESEQCELIQCEPGFGNCDNDPATGCETALLTEQDCGACDVVCAMENASVSCATGSCQLVECNAGFDDCNHDVTSPETDGCEQALNTLEHCGACDRACSFDNASASCESGSCQFEQCDSGYGDCNRDIDSPDTDGCETHVSLIDSDVAGHWKLDETSGLSAEDVAAGGKHGALTNMAGTEWTAGVEGGALRFDGLDDHVNVGDVGSDIYTVAFWIKHEATEAEGEPTDTGFVSPSATGDDYADWSEPENAHASDDWRASGPAGGQQDWHGFGLAIPAGAGIAGIEVRIEGNGGFAATGALVELSWDGGVSYTSTGKAVLFDFEPISDETQTEGSPSDLWGRSSWSANAFTDDNFRVRLQTAFGVVPGASVFVDQLQVRVSYTTPPVLADKKVINLDGTAHVEVVDSGVNAVSFGGTATVYIDGSVGSAIDTEWHHVAISSTVGVAVTSLEIGKYGTDPHHFLGLIDDLRIYDRVLTETEIALLAGTADCAF